MVVARLPCCGSGGGPTRHAYGCPMSDSEIDIRALLKRMSTAPRVLRLPWTVEYIDGVAYIYDADGKLVGEGPGAT